MKGRVGVVLVLREIWGELEGYLYVVSFVLCVCVDYWEIDLVLGIVIMWYVMIFFWGEFVFVNLFIFCIVFCRFRVRNCFVYSILIC